MLQKNLESKENEKTEETSSDTSVLIHILYM